ncbi:MAG: hypothetical protein M1813_009570 [Trichoglossum hirsutum]|nr:MAG: hypothetical protein M1813_009570 [Trichoglossum hirsutum]
MSFANIYHLRRVAEASAKPCEICFKPTTAVLITADNKTDFFYVCLGHLKDKGFASPIIDEKEAAAKKKEELEQEVERVKKEFEEKQKKKKEKEKAKEKEGKKGEKDEEKKDKTSTKNEKEKEDEDGKAKSSTTEEIAAAEKVEDSPRVYSLHK